MGDYAFLALTDAATPSDHGGRNAVQFECKYWVPVLWELMFANKDAHEVNRSTPDRFFRVDRSLALHRLKRGRRKAAELGPEATNFYQDWLDYLEDHPTHHCILRGEVIGSADPTDRWFPHAANSYRTVKQDGLAGRDAEHRAGLMFGYAVGEVGFKEHRSLMLAAPSSALVKRLDAALSEVEAAFKRIPAKDDLGFRIAEDRRLFYRHLPVLLGEAVAELRAQPGTSGARSMASAATNMGWLTDRQQLAIREFIATYWLNVLATYIPKIEPSDIYRSLVNITSLDQSEMLATWLRSEEPGAILNLGRSFAVVHESSNSALRAWLDEEPQRAAIRNAPHRLLPELRAELKKWSAAAG